MRRARSTSREQLLALLNAFDLSLAQHDVVATNRQRYILVPLLIYAASTTRNATAAPSLPLRSVLTVCLLTRA